MGVNCSRCGSELSPDILGGLCPKCLLELGVEAETSDSPETSETSAATASQQPGKAQAPEFIGLYRILDLLGEGGMGLVYLAEQRKPIHRRVAVKVIKIGMDTEEVIARFEVEREALALMNHPSIARVLDAGSTEEGRPYFVMEYVAGISITEYCDRHRLGTRERLEIFQAVCSAIQHAHQKGIIHRDIKPSNVLVEVQDGRPIPKVIDFGIAKATNRRLTEHTFFTRHGMLIGTPAYMSPEQAEMSLLDVDTRSDIYSLGALLYELLVGVPPFDPKELLREGYARIREILLEQDPPPLTTRLTRLGEQAAAIAKCRNTDPGHLGKELKDDLEWITLKALEKDRTRRYPSASELAADIARHLGDEPVAAGSPSFIYRLEKFVRKHRAPVLAGGALTLTLLAGLAVSTHFYFQSRAAADEARRHSYVANLEAAASHLANRAADAARERLDACPVELRDWEWRHLSLKADSSLVALKSERPVVLTAYSPDGSKVYWVSAEDFQLRETNSRDYSTRVIAASESDASPAYVAAFHPQSGRVAVVRWLGEALQMQSDPESFVHTLSATSSSDENKGVLEVLAEPGGTVVGRLENVSSGEVTRISQGDSFNFFGSTVVEQLAFVLNSSFKPILRVSWPRIILASFDTGGQRIAAWSWDGVIQVLDLETGRASQLRDGHSYGITAVLFSPDAEKLVSSSFDGSIRIWDLATGRSVAKSLDIPVRSLALAPDGKVFASGTEAGSVELWDWNGNIIASQIGRGEAVSALAFSPAGDFLAVAHGDKAVDLYSRDLSIQLGAIFGCHGSALSLAFNQDGKQLASGGNDGTLQIWDPAVRDGAVVRNITENLVTTVDVNRVGRYLAVADNSEPLSAMGGERFLDSLQLRDLATDTFREFSASEVAGLQVVRFNPVREEIVGGFVDGRIRVWNALSGQILPQLIGTEASVTALGFRPDGEVLAAGSADLAVRLWNLSDGEQIALLQIPGDTEPERVLRSRWRPELGLVVQPRVSGDVRTAAFSSDGTRLLVGVEPGLLHLWEVSSGRLLRTYTAGPAGAFTPGGNKVVSYGSEDGTIALWDFSGKLLSRGKLHNSQISGISFSPNGRRLATGGEDGIVKIVDSETLQALLTLTGHSRAVRTVRFDETGSRLISVSEDGEVRIWHSRDEE